LRRAKTRDPAPDDDTVILFFRPGGFILLLDFEKKFDRVSWNVMDKVWHRMDFVGHGTIQSCFSHCGNQQIILSKIWFASISQTRVPRTSKKIRKSIGTLPLPYFFGCPWKYVHWLREWGCKGLLSHMAMATKQCHKCL
jgi:hypothetical protein